MDFVWLEQSKLFPVSSLYAKINSTMLLLAAATDILYRHINGIYVLMYFPKCLNISLSVLTLCKVLLTVNFQDVFGSGAAVKLVDVLRDDGNITPLFAESLLTLCNSQVSRVRIFCEHDLAAVVVKLPDTGGIPREGLWGGEFLTE